MSLFYGWRRRPGGLRLGQLMELRDVPAPEGDEQDLNGMIGQVNEDTQILSSPECIRGHRRQLVGVLHRGEQSKCRYL